MLGKTNIVYVAKDQGSEMQFVVEYIPSITSANIVDMKFYNGFLFAFTLYKNVLFGTDAGNMKFLNFNDDLLQATDVLFFNGEYIFFDRYARFPINTDNKEVSLKYYASKNLEDIEERTVKVDSVAITGIGYSCDQSLIAGMAIDGDNNLTILILSTKLPKDGILNNSVLAIPEVIFTNDIDTGTVKKKVTGKDISIYLNKFYMYFMRNRYMIYSPGNTHSSTNYYHSISIYDGMLGYPKNEPVMVKDDIAYYIIDSKLYYSINFVDQKLLRGSKTDGIFPVGNRLAIYSDDKIFLADTLQGISDNMAREIEVGEFDYGIGVAVEADEGNTYMGCMNGIITKCFLDADGEYKIPEVQLVKTLAARQALSQAKDYTDGKVAELRLYIDSLFN